MARPCSEEIVAIKFVRIRIVRERKIPRMKSEAATLKSALTIPHKVSLARRD